MEIENKIHINISMPNSKEKSAHYKREPLLDKIREYINICNSDYSSEFHWKYLKALYTKICGCPKMRAKFPEEHKLLNEFFRDATGYASGDNFVDMDGADFWEGVEDYE